MSKAKVLPGDCLDLLLTVDAESVHACVCDPPYDLTASKKGGKGTASVNLDNPYGRARIGTGNGAGGFMGKAWDGTGIAFRSDLWELVFRVLKPGAFLLAFGGTRTSHRMACAIEDAGFEIRDSIAWMYATGFPKSKNLSGEWDGWGTALKPAFEPIIVARKPLAKPSVQANMDAYACGALNIAACRVERAAGDVPGWHETGSNGTAGYQGTDTFKAREMSPEEIQERCGGGRWPANVLLGHADGCGEMCEAGCPVALLDRQSAVSRSKPFVGAGAHQNILGGGMEYTGAGYHDEGTASRFFHQFPPFLFEAKPSRAERDRGCERLGDRTRNRVNPGGLEHDPKWAPVQAKNVHPTVKPLSLLRHLVRLVTPPDGLVLDPFCGSGTTGMACLEEGFDFVGMEREAEYVEIACARMQACQSLFGTVELTDWPAAGGRE